MKKLNLLTLLFIMIALSNCEQTELTEEQTQRYHPPKIETVNGLDDPAFIELIAPLTEDGKKRGRIEESDYEHVFKVTGENYVNYSLPIDKLNDTENAAHALILKNKDDTLFYNLLEIVPDVSWFESTDTGFSNFSGRINTYPILFTETESSGRVETKTTVADCMEFVIEEVIVHADLSATVVGSWQPCEENGDGGGGSTEGGGYSWVPAWGSEDSGNWSDGGLTGSGGGSGGAGHSPDNGDTEEIVIPTGSVEDFLADLWEEQIDDSQLKPCMQSIMTALKNLTQGVGQIVTKFAGSTPGYNWKTVHGPLPSNENAQTSTAFNFSTGTVTTTFDTNKFSFSTDLSVARTILHEAVHAYVVAATYNSLTPAERQQLLGPNWINAYINNGHSFMASDYVSDIAQALQEYGQSQGYSLGTQFYTDLAWGGLTHYDSNNTGNYVETPWFKGAIPNSTDRTRIVNRINSEQNGTNQSKGNHAGC